MANLSLLSRNSALALVLLSPLALMLIEAQTPVGPLVGAAPEPQAVFSSWAGSDYPKEQRCSLGLAGPPTSSSSSSSSSLSSRSSSSSSEPLAAVVATAAPAGESAAISSLFQRLADAVTYRLSNMDTWQGFTIALLWMMLPGFSTAYGTALFFDHLYLPFLLRRGWAVSTTDRTIQESSWHVAGVNLLASFTAAIAPNAMGLLYMKMGGVTNIDWSLSPLKALWVLLVIMLLHDTYFYWVHRLLHVNRFLYRHVHADHHSGSVMLEARTGLYISTLEAFILVGLFHVVGVCVSKQLVGVAPLVIALPIFTSIQVNVIGHSGVKFTNPLPLLMMNPFLVALLFTGTAQSPMDHQTHHEQPMYNMAPYFRHWDEWFGTAAPVKGRLIASPLLIAYNLAFYAALTWGVAYAGSVPASFWAATAAAAGLLALLPVHKGGWDSLRKLGLWDRVRDAYGCTTHCDHPLNPSQRYIFAYHPHGVLARGFWWTFGLQGRSSPVAVAGIRVQLGVHKVLLSIPGVRQVLGLIGCCGIDKPSLLEQLRKEVPTSVALCPGGWEEGKYAGTQKLLLAKRTGFVKLALETGAQLVPVLALGEEAIGKSMLTALLLPAKRTPLKVIFGEPIPFTATMAGATAQGEPMAVSLETASESESDSEGAPLVLAQVVLRNPTSSAAAGAAVSGGLILQGKGFKAQQPPAVAVSAQAVSELHARYVGALQDLAKAHGVTLQVV